MPKAFAARQLATLLLLCSAPVCGGSALAQSAPATPASATPTAKPVKSTASTATSPAVSALAIPVSKAVGGKIVGCPRSLKVSVQAVCLYAKAAAATVRGNVKTAVGNLAVTDWKMNGQTGLLLVQNAPNGKLDAVVMTAPLSAQETLVVLDAIAQRPAAGTAGAASTGAVATAPAPVAAPPVAVPAGVVKGQPYLLDKDLAGVVNVINLGGGKYRLNAAGQTALTVNVGSKTAQRAGGNVELPLAPLTDGHYLIFPVAGLRALGCTVTDNASGITIACGSDSVGVKPIVF